MNSHSIEEVMVKPGGQVTTSDTDHSENNVLDQQHITEATQEGGDGPSESVPSNTNETNDVVFETRYDGNSAINHLNESHGQLEEDVSKDRHDYAEAGDKALECTQMEEAHEPETEDVYLDVEERASSSEMAANATAGTSKCDEADQRSVEDQAGSSDAYFSAGTRTSSDDSSDSDIFPTLRGHYNLHFSLSGTDSSDEEELPHKSALKARAKEKPPATDLPPVPADKISFLSSLRKRECGIGKGWPTQSRHEFTGSVSLTRRLKKIALLDHHDGCVNALHFNQTGNLLASGSDDLSIVVWNWCRKVPYFTFKSGHSSNVFQCKFMPYSGDSHMVTCARDGQVRLAELSTTGQCRATKKLVQHRGAAHKLALMEDSSHTFYSCGEDGVVFQYDLRQDQAHKLVEVKNSNSKVPLYSIHANPMLSTEFCVSGRDQFVRVYDVRNLQQGDGQHPILSLCPQAVEEKADKLSVTCAVYNWNGEEILASYNDEDIYLFQNHIDTADAFHIYSGHRNNATVKGVNFYGLRSEFIVSGSDCGHVFLWDKDSETIVNYFKADRGGVVNVLEPYPHGPVLATSGLDNDIKIWAPLAEKYAGLHGLKKRIKRNVEEREQESMYQTGNSFDTQLIWMLMNHFNSASEQMDEEDEGQAAGGAPAQVQLGQNQEEEAEEEDSGDDDNVPLGCSTS